MAHRWPEGARCVAVMSCDFDGYGNEVGRGWAQAGSRSAGGYSARAGVPRMLDIFGRHGIPATFFVPGYDAEQHPDLCRRMVELGHEVAAHGYVHESWDVSAEEETELLRRSHDILTRVTGTAPVGWRSPGGQKSDITLNVLRDLGYIYDSSDKDYDQPYPAIVGGEPSTEMIELPNNTSSLDDAYIYRETAAAPSDMFGLWRREFEAIYNESGYFVLTYHPRSGFGSGTPARARAVDRLIAYIKTFPDVHFTRLSDLARWCLDPDHGFMRYPVRIGGRP